MTGCPLTAKWAAAWPPGDVSQHPTDPHVKHMRRCTQRVPARRHSGQPKGGTAGVVGGLPRCEQRRRVNERWNLTRRISSARRWRAIAAGYAAVTAVGLRAPPAVRLVRRLLLGTRRYSATRRTVQATPAYTPRLPTRSGTQAREVRLAPGSTEQLPLRRYTRRTRVPRGETATEEPPCAGK
jgi:hypothetical protein